MITMSYLLCFSWSCGILYYQLSSENRAKLYFCEQQKVENNILSMYLKSAHVLTSTYDMIRPEQVTMAKNATQSRIWINLYIIT